VVCVYVRARVRVCARAYVCVYVGVYVRACSCLYMLAHAFQSYEYNCITTSYEHAALYVCIELYPAHRYDRGYTAHADDRGSHTMFTPASCANRPNALYMCVVCVYVRARVRVCARAYVCVYVGVYVRACTYVRTCACGYAHVYARVCV
jgi:hypothetical protein